MTAASRRKRMFSPRPIRVWQLGGRRLELGRRTLLMAILNLTPDSFFAGSRLDGEPAAMAAAEAALEAGADVLDLGAESTRPGAAALNPAEEQSRLLPVLERLRARFPQAWLSADTRHGATARAALQAGADIINDVSGLANPAMLATAAASNCGLVLMHLRGDFSTMHRLPPLADPVGEVTAGFKAILARMRAAGIDIERVVLDPGFGFGKNMAENFPLLARFDAWHALGCPLLAGVSRKSFIAYALAGTDQTGARRPPPPPEARLHGTLAAVIAAILNGAHIVRVHDLAAARDAARVADAVLEASASGH